MLCLILDPIQATKKTQQTQANDLSLLTDNVLFHRQATKYNLGRNTNGDHCPLCQSSCLATGIGKSQQGPKKVFY